MVKKKNEKNLLEFIHEEAEKRKRDNPIVKTRWFVVEITPAYQYATGDGHGGTDWEWQNQQETIVSKSFETKSDAKKWMDEHEPDEGKTLEVRYENQRKFTEYRWVNW